MSRNLCKMDRDIREKYKRDNIYGLYTKEIIASCKKWGIDFNKLHKESIGEIIWTYKHLTGKKYDNGKWIDDKELTLRIKPKEFKKLNGITLIHSVMHNLLLNSDLKYKNNKVVRVKNVKTTTESLAEHLQMGAGVLNES